jgi:hypothetical protein
MRRSLEVLNKNLNFNKFIPETQLAHLQLVAGAL